MTELQLLNLHQAVVNTFPSINISNSKGLFINDVISFGGYPDPPPPPQVMTSFMNSP